MKAIQLVGYGDVDQLVLAEVPMPEPESDEILVKMAATSVNPIDYKIREGALKAFMPVTFPMILGNDVAGAIVKVGSDVRGFAPGQKVLGVVMASYAEYVKSKVQSFAPVPEGMNLEQAGALPLILLTGAQLVELGMGVKSGQTILVTGALGSVGRTAVFAAREVGAKVIAGVRAKQRGEAETLGAEDVVAIDDDAGIAALPELDGVADTVGGDVIQKLLPKIKAGGVVGSVLGDVPGAKERNLRVGAISAKPDSKRLQELAIAVDQGRLRIPIAKTFPLSETAQAHTMAQKGGVNGKIVITP